jgi:hypothetical protein
MQVNLLDEEGWLEHHRVELRAAARRGAVDYWADVE